MHSNNIVEETNTEVENTRRNFIKKFGKYAATAPVGMYMLMTPSQSAAHSSGSSNHDRRRYKRLRRRLRRLRRREQRIERRLSRL